MDTGLSIIGHAVIRPPPDPQPPDDSHAASVPPASRRTPDVSVLDDPLEQQRFTRWVHRP